MESSKGRFIGELVMADCFRVFVVNGGLGFWGGKDCRNIGGRCVSFIFLGIFLRSYLKC